MYILEHYTNINKQKELIEMMTMEEETQGIIAQLKNEGRNEGKLEVLEFLLKSHTIEEITNIFGMPFEEAFNVSKN